MLVNQTEDGINITSGRENCDSPIIFPTYGVLNHFHIIAFVENDITGIIDTQAFYSLEFSNQENKVTATNNIDTPSQNRNNGRFF